ncbi:glycosyl hydrolase family 43 [Fusarium acutatum]|uniref:Glycosyl hydrolase family 43 n=1 Tax=Fusarium acutatum TaxID=78861 RepID=A0A8H4JCK0_9HYPO|nr:glycosyl hydrolase family 43 [Fusarium acutatum]
MMIFSLLIATAAVFQLRVAAETFNQPPIFQDLPDVDLVRVDDTYYYSASTFHYSPGAPILRSYDLVNWEYLSHSLPSFDFNDPKFNLTKGRAYNGGVYASSLRYHKTQKTFYWLGCIQKNGETYVYTAPKIEGPWTKASTISNYCLYDAGLLVDDDDTIYVSSGQWTPNGAESQTWISKLDENLQVEKQESVFKSNEGLGYIEGSRFYKINGTYFLWLTNPGVGRGQIIVKSSGDVWGPYDSWHRVLKNNGNPIEGSGSPHQGAFVETPKGDYWYMAFVELGTSGRFPVLAPLKWDEEGWPNVELDSNANWKSSYDYPLPRHNVEPVEGTFEFTESKLPPRFEWNHDPNNDKWTTGPDGLVLHTATITNDFFSAQNTMTHRILGPQSNVTIELDYSSMVDGDRAGLVSLRYDAGWIGIAKDGDSTTLQMVDNAAMDPDNNFVTTSKGTVIASKSISGGKIWLRCQISTVFPNRSTFLYSTDGKTFVKLGQEHVTKQGGVWFTGTRHGIFNFATKKGGGHVVVKKFDIRLS